MSTSPMVVMSSIAASRPLTFKINAHLCGSGVQENHSTTFPIRQRVFREVLENVPSLGHRMWHATISPENTMDTVDTSWMRMFSEGPEVSLKGSPTVSPTTAALWQSEPLPPWWPASMYFFALSQAPPALDMNTAMAKPVTDTPPSSPTTPSGPRS